MPYTTDMLQILLNVRAKLHNIDIHHARDDLIRNGTIPLSFIPFSLTAEALDPKRHGRVPALLRFRSEDTQVRTNACSGMLFIDERITMNCLPRIGSMN